jgi:hypothetical protein
MKLLKVVAFAVPILLFGSCAVMFARWVQEVNRPPDIAEGVKSVDWLPSEATDINYCRSYGFTAFEFKISEAGFREWAATVTHRPREYVEYQPVTEISKLKENHFFPIQRYNSRLAAGQDLPENFDYDKHHRTTTIEITNGLRGEMRRGSAGGYSIGYDRDTDTAYYQTNPR